MIQSPDISTSEMATVTAVSASFAAVMGTSGVDRWMFVSSTNCWIKQGTGVQTATAGSGSMFVPAGVTIYLNGNRGNRVAVIRDTADGKASLTRVV